MDKKLIIFDVDGTLVETKSGATFRKTVDDWQWMSGRLVVLQSLAQKDIWLALATNQGGVAFGHYTENDIDTELRRMCSEGHITDYRVCFNHPQGTISTYRKEDDNRKPGPGMLLDLIEHFSGIIKQDTLYVGDRPEDEQAAKNAGIDFMWAWDFFNDPKQE